MASLLLSVCQQRTDDQRPNNCGSMGSVFVTPLYTLFSPCLAGRPNILALYCVRASMCPSRHASRSFPSPLQTDFSSHTTNNTNSKVCKGSDTGQHTRTHALHHGKQSQNLAVRPNTCTHPASAPPPPSLPVIARCSVHRRKSTGS
jgi:hypothetical protein